MSTFVESRHQGGLLRRIVAIRLLSAVCLVCAVLSTAALTANAADPYPPMYNEAALFERAMRSVAAVPAVPPEVRVTGLTVPHHLLAADLIAYGFSRVRAQRYERIVILSPDHNSWGTTYFSIPKRNFMTCLGTVPLDREAAAILLNNAQVAESNLFSREHGVQALLPFIAALFPDVPVIPIALRVRAGHKDWDGLAATLAPLLTPKTLLIQSTDFSHYLPAAEAAKKDQETLRVLSGSDLKQILLLNQPGHTDSKAGQYLQMKLQREVYNARLNVEANANAVDFMPEWEKGGAPPERTTSYIVQLYAEQYLPSRLERVFFGGDFFTGRHVAEVLDQPDKREELVRMITEVTQGAPLIVNFEGVLMAACPDAAAVPPKELRLCMPQGATLALMRDLNIVAASLANNHSHDFGDEAFAATQQALQKAGIAALGQGDMLELPRLRLAAFTDVDNKREPRARILEPKDFAELSAHPGSAAAKPLAVLLHYGREFAPTPGYRERALADLLKEHGADIIIGSHAHLPGKLEGTPERVWAWSLGNFLFDQKRKEATCALLEVVLFPQGTYWVRQHNLGNTYVRLLRKTEPVK